MLLRDLKNNFEEENKTDIINTQTSFITTLYTFKNLSTSERICMLFQHSKRGRGQCVILHMEINVDLIVIRAIWEADACLFATIAGVWAIPSPLYRSWMTHTHKSSPQFQYRWIISFPTSFCLSVSCAQPPDYDPSMNSFSVWWVCCPHTSLKTKTSECV